MNVWKAGAHAGVAVLAVLRHNSSPVVALHSIENELSPLLHVPPPQELAGKLEGAMSSARLRTTRRRCLLLATLGAVPEETRAAALPYVEAEDPLRPTERRTILEAAVLS